MTYHYIKKITLAYVLKVKKAGIPIKGVYLFGSAAKGKMHKGSDIDICVVSSKFGKKPHDERLFLMRLQKGVSDRIEPHPYSPKDFSNKFDPLIQEIKRNGIQII